MKRFFQTFLMSFAMVFVLFSIASVAQAQLVQSDVSKGCDVDFYEQLQASSELKATQELEAAQAIILKPDSVLEYTCFQSRVQTAGSALPFQNDLSDMLGTLAGEPFERYLEGNFDHALDGGHSSVRAGDPCSVMAAVWQSAQCHDFDVRLFSDFTEMASNDMRLFPQQCSNSAARNQDVRGLVLDAKRPAGAPGGAEQVAAYQPQLKDCGLPIPTGLQAEVLDDQVYRKVKEKICTAPGCYYDFKSETCKAN